MDDAMGVMKVIRLTSDVEAHRRLRDQFLGFAWSVGLSHVTYDAALAYSRCASTEDVRTRFGSVSGCFASTALSS